MFAYLRINVRSLSLIKRYAGFCYSRPFATKSDVGDSPEKCVVTDFPLLTEAVNTKNFELVSKLVTEQVMGKLYVSLKNCCLKDPFEVKRIRIPANNSRKSPNLIPSQSGRRMLLYPDSET
ncbi:hypothetical protein MN116_002159 [Schistosoma mekongi]|uniref:Uncharacterized protein n=1 Tax=Schistosoma mekongi TaxID=38744 RepID=A0AAE1ZJN7_SCHME|nr:hypothetical protein MN116_002159 [Schistosoma mekongi]